MRTGFKSTANGMLLDAFATRLPTTTFQSRRIHRQAIFQSLVSQNPTAATGAPEIPFLHLPANPSNVSVQLHFIYIRLTLLLPTVDASPRDVRLTPARVAHPIGCVQRCHIIWHPRIPNACPSLRRCPRMCCIKMLIGLLSNRTARRTQLLYCFLWRFLYDCSKLY